MVLDTIDEENNVFTFKNTYDDPENGQSQQVKVRRTDPNAPEELYFVHIEVKDINNLPGQKDDSFEIMDYLPDRRGEAKKSSDSFSSDDEKSCWWCCFCKKTCEKIS